MVRRATAPGHLDFVQPDARGGGEEKTQVWMGYDDEALYFAFRCLDTQPDKIRTNISRRDNAFS